MATGFGIEQRTASNYNVVFGPWLVGSHDDALTSVSLDESQFFARNN